MTRTSPPPADDDAPWRRPAEPASDGGADTRAAGSVAPQPAPAPRYTGPPKAPPPPFGWRPPVVVRPLEPRQMPAQNHPALDQQEQAARTITSGVGLIGGAIMLLMLLVLCGRWLF